jgi:hypothetical protein
MKFFISATKITFVFGATLSFLLLGVGSLAYFDSSAIRFQSLESKTMENGPVFNEVRYLKHSGKEIWMMNQSHHGLQAPAQQWDRLAIVISRENEKKVSHFYQLPPGRLEWSEDLPAQNLNLKVSCFACHNNGPRAIRPDNEGLSLNAWSKLRVQLWNLKIKTSGRIYESEKQRAEDQHAAVPFRRAQDRLNESLKIETCSLCHREESEEGGKAWFARGILKRQQRATIAFLTENKLMPPPGFELSATELQNLKLFVNGF